MDRHQKQKEKIENNNKQKVTLYILSRDFRTEDNLTLYKAYDESLSTGTKLCVLFRFHPDQISKDKNPYYCSNAVQFMIESLENFADDINYNWIEPISDSEWETFLKSLPLNKIFIMRDFSPFAKKRFEFLSSIIETEEVDDVTVHPIEEYNTYHKLAHFVDNAKRKTFQEPEIRKIDWKKTTTYLSDLTEKKGNFKFLHKGKIEIPHEINKNILAHPKDLTNLLSSLAVNLKGYSVKKIRESVGFPKVSYLSTFIKFGLVSIRTIHQIAKESSINGEDKLAFERELYFRDFYYRLAWAKSFEVFTKPNWQGEIPRFINEEDLLLWKKQNGKNPIITKEESKDIELAREVYNKWTEGDTEYPLINASIMQLNSTGYMLNRTRMLTASYLTQDNKLWWKYAEKYFATKLTEYDWTINSLNHQNIAKVGLYPKFTQNFSIKRQESMNPKDKAIYIKNYVKK